MQTEKDLEVQDETKLSLSDGEKYNKCLEIYRLAKEISKRVDHPIVFITHY